MARKRRSFNGKHGPSCPCVNCDERWPATSMEPPKPTFEKYSSSETRDTGTPQTDLFFGEKGTKGGHIAVDDSGTTLYARDGDGTEVYDPRRGDEPDSSKGWS